jgi:pyrroline-5-carboxylate reductase
LFAPTGQSLWVAQEDDLDAVTALSGSGPAYVFYFIEAMVQAGAEMGLDAAQARRLAQATFAGATALAQASPLAPAELRAQVTSKGGTTHAAISALEAQDVKAAFVRALHAARDRAAELGRAGG